MNIQCQQCGTSYAVADEKVRGRLMKVRCKSCSEVIRVDGTVLGVADGSSAPPQLTKPVTSRPMSKPPSLVNRPGTEGAVWHIAIGDSTQGPYTLDELREYYAQGSVVLDTLVYRDGFDAWTPAGEVPELAAQAHLQSGALAFAGGVSMGSDPFGERRPQSSIQSPRVSAGEMLDENLSHEHTVQFSLDQIRALSAVSQSVQHQAVSPSNMPPRMMGTSPGSIAGYASGDGSGLIDVRKLAELHRAMTEERSVDETDSSALLPAHGSYAHTLAPLSLPLSAAAHQSGSIDGKTKLIAGLAAFGMVLAAAVGVLALTRPQPASQLEAGAAAAAQPFGSAPTAAAPEEEADKPAAEPAAEAKAEAPVAEETVKADQAEEDSEPATASRSGSKRNKRSSGSSSSKSKSKADDEEPVAKADKAEKLSAKDSIDDLLSDGPTKSKGKNSSASASIDDLLDNAVSGKKAAPKAEEKAPASDLPQTPGRDQMLSALAKAGAKASKCKGPGVATAQIKIAGSSGKATSVNVTGAEGPAAACVEKAVRSTSFPKFQKDNFEVKFPFKLGA
jgi:predicted Zn finger-like uncharacterized protein